MVLELARVRTSIDQWPECARPGASSVDDSSRVHVEELDGEDAHVLELVEQLPGEALSRAPELLRQGGLRA